MNVAGRSILLNMSGVLAASAALRMGLNINWFLAWVAIVNLWLLALMLKDKTAAERKTRRTPEATLLILAMAGGTPGLFLGRWWFRHKTTKESFNGALVGVVAIQAGFLVWKLFF